MIIDTITNAPKYFSVHPLFTKAFEYINNTDLANESDGRHEIGSGLKAIFSNKNGMTEFESVAKFECHNKHIDIQVCIKGEEQLGWKPREKCTMAKGEYNEEKDVQFYSDAPDMFFKITDSQFAIFFPEDVHAPMIGEGPIKKMVIKVPL